MKKLKKCEKYAIRTKEDLAIKKRKEGQKTKKKPDRIPYAMHFLKASGKAFFKIMKNHKIIKSKK